MADISVTLSDAIWHVNRIIMDVGFRQDKLEKLEGFDQDAANSLYMEIYNELDSIAEEAAGICKTAYKVQSTLSDDIEQAFQTINALHEFNVACRRRLNQIDERTMMLRQLIKGDQ